MGKHNPVAQNTSQKHLDGLNTAFRFFLFFFDFTFFHSSGISSIFHLLLLRENTHQAQLRRHLCATMRLTKAAAPPVALPSSETLSNVFARPTGEGSPEAKDSPHYVRTIIWMDYVAFRMRCAGEDDGTTEPHYWHTCLHGIEVRNVLIVRNLALCCPRPVWINEWICYEPRLQWPEGSWEGMLVVSQALCCCAALLHYRIHGVTSFERSRIMMHKVDRETMCNWTGMESHRPVGGTWTGL